MTASGDTIDSVEEGRTRTEGPGRAPHDSKPIRLTILVGAMLVRGVIGRMLLAGGFVDALLAGPAAGTGLVSLIPPGIVARSVSIDGTVMVVDLSGDYLARTSPLCAAAPAVDRTSSSNRSLCPISTRAAL